MDRLPTHYGRQGQPRSQVIYHSPRFKGYVASLVLSKCILAYAYFLSYNILNYLHVVQFLFIARLVASTTLVIIQKPFSSGSKLTRSQWLRVFRHAVINSSLALLELFGLTLCGPLRTILLTQHKDLVVIVGIKALFTSAGGHSKFRGAICFILAVLSLLFLDFDDKGALPTEHPEGYQHHGLSHAFYYVVSLLGLPDHKGGALLLALTLLLQTGFRTLSRTLAVDVGGAKRLNALSSVISTVLLAPLLLFVKVPSSMFRQDKMPLSSPGPGTFLWSASTDPKEVPVDLFLRNGISSVPVALVPNNDGIIRMKNPKIIQEELRYGRVEVLSGFMNGLFLVVIAFMVFSEAITRLFDPPQVKTERLLTVSIAGLIVNLIGILAFRHTHSHSHGASHSHSHSHGHSHTGANTNLQGVFLHILADTLGSVGVIVSSLLIDQFGLLVADPLCSVFIAVLIFVSVLPLLKHSSMILVLRTPLQLEGKKLPSMLSKVLKIEGVLSYRNEHFWYHTSDVLAGSLHVQIAKDANSQKVLSQVTSLFKELGMQHFTVQVEKEEFFQHMSGLRASTNYYSNALLRSAAHQASNGALSLCIVKSI
nr:zinc transporter 5-like [Rhipicephalus microplus]